VSWLRQHVPLVRTLETYERADATADLLAGLTTRGHAHSPGHGLRDARLDSSAEAALHDLLDEYRGRGIRLIVARAKGPVMDVLERSGFASEAGPSGFVECVADAFHVAETTLRQPAA